MKRFASALTIIVLATACSMLPGGGTTGGAADPPGAGVPANPAAEMRPDLLVIDPTTAAPGDVVALTFPAETTRGILFVLDQRVGDTWVTRFYLRSDGPGEGWEMSWHAADVQGMDVEAIGVGGPGPDHVPIPEPTEPGAYRICTGNAGADFCAPIEIVRP